MTRRFGCAALAASPFYRGIGYAVFDHDRTPLDWGVKETRTDKAAACLRHVSELIALFRPRHVVLELADVPTSRRHHRIRELISELAVLCERRNVATVLFPRQHVYLCLGLQPSDSKDAMARAIGRKIPTLAHRVPAPRRPWESEKHAMAMFMAAALALTHFHEIDMPSLFG
jgi:hypothetical protein